MNCYCRRKGRCPVSQMAPPARWKKSYMLSTTGQSCREQEGELSYTGRCFEKCVMWNFHADFQNGNGISPFESLPLITKWFGTYHFCRDVLKPVAIIRSLMVVTKSKSRFMRGNRGVTSRWQPRWQSVTTWRANTHTRTQKCSDFKLFNVEKNAVLP